jgi:hypothetical protein
MTPIANVVSWLIMSGIIYVVAKLLLGKGNYETQSYLYAIYNAPLSIVVAVVSMIPVFGPFFAIVPAIYGLYLLTMSLKETHSYTVGRAILTWLIPVVAIALVVTIVGFAIASFFVGNVIGSVPGLNGV